MSRIYNQIIHLSWSGACALHTKLYKHRTKAQESVRTICIVEVPRGFLCLANLPPFSLVLPMSGNSLWLELTWKSIALDFPKRGKMTRWALRLRLFQDLLSIGPFYISMEESIRCNGGFSWINSSLKDGKLRRRSCASAGQPHLETVKTSCINMYHLFHLFSKHASFVVLTRHLSETKKNVT